MLYILRALYLNMVCVQMCTELQQHNTVMSCTVPVWPVIYTIVVFHTAQLLA